MPRLKSRRRSPALRAAPSTLALPALAGPAP